MIVGYDMSESLIGDSVIIRASLQRAIPPSDPLIETWPRNEDGIPYTWDLHYEPRFEAWVNPPSRLARSFGQTFEGRIVSAWAKIESRARRATEQGRRRYRQLYPVTSMEQMWAS